MDCTEAKKIFKHNFIGPDELRKIEGAMNISPISTTPNIPYSAQFLRKISKDYILIFGISKDRNGNALTINSMRNFFGIDPAQKEPCFYNQDWYLKEKFADKTVLKPKWYLIRKTVIGRTKGVYPDVICGKLDKSAKLPPAVLTAFVFFSYYFLNNGAKLWKNSFIWCDDKDSNGDRIFTGRYEDPKKINKNGFNVHRHLRIRNVHGAAPMIK